MDASVGYILAVKNVTILGKVWDARAFIQGMQSIGSAIVQGTKEVGLADIDSTAGPHQIRWIRPCHIQCTVPMHQHSLMA